VAFGTGGFGGLWADIGKIQVRTMMKFTVTSKIIDLSQSQKVREPLIEQGNSRLTPAIIM